ncbi:hypothetical protein niasHS_013667 [Heterodera schachtii]|uniref:Secreted protein n=2 Tax=Heterodera TaxID=34509 RepID=A0ABD2IIU0_HETSC
MTLHILLVFFAFFAYGTAQPEPVFCPGFSNQHDCLAPKIVDGSIHPANWCHWLRNTCQWNTPNIGQRYCFRKPHSQCLAPFCLIDKRLTHTCIAAFQGCVERITPVTCDGVRLLYNHRCQWYPAGATPQNPFFPICGTPYKDRRQNNRMQMLL